MRVEADFKEFGYMEESGQAKEESMQTSWGDIPWNIYICFARKLKEIRYLG